jgi:hypothetical protein
MDDSDDGLGTNVEQIGHLNLGGAMHPVVLTDGRIMFSSSESQGLRVGEQWGLWTINPDGTGWNPLFSPFIGGSTSLHFHTQLSNGDGVVEKYYAGGTTQGFGTFIRFSTTTPYGEALFGPAYTEDPRNMTRARKDNVRNRYQKFPFSPRGMRIVTEFCTHDDVAPDNAQSDMGKVTHPSGAPDNHLLCVWATPGQGSDKAERGNPHGFDSGIYLIRNGEPVEHPDDMLRVKDDPAYQEMWPRALVPYSRIYGIEEPGRPDPIRNDGKTSPHLPEGTPFGIVGTSSLYKRESFPDGVVPEGSVTAGPRYGNDPAKIIREIGGVYRDEGTPNWTTQGSDAGYYTNDDIWGIRIVALEPVTRVGNEPQHFGLASGGNGVGPFAAERLRILGEFPVRKFDKDGRQPVDPDGNPDTSFLAKIPADLAWTFQTIDKNGLMLNMAQTWHQVRPGELRNDCGGCHAHSQKPTDFNLTAAAKADYQPFDLTKQVPLFATKAQDQSGKQWDPEQKTGVRYAAAGVVSVEYHRDVKPIFQRSCVACHSRQRPDAAANGLVLDDEEPTRAEGYGHPLPTTYVRLAFDNEAKFGPKPVGRQWNYRQQMSRYVRAMQARRSMLVWKVFGRRLDGFHNDDLPTERVAGDPGTLEWRGAPVETTSENLRIADLDFTGSVMPPPEAVAGTYKDAGGNTIKVEPLSDEDRLTIARWIDLGCPIDLDYDPAQPERRGYGWMCDDQRPTLSLTYPRAGENASLERILVGAHDYDSGLDERSLSVTADFEIDGAKPGEELAGKLKPRGDGVWELTLDEPVAVLAQGRLVVSVKDRSGNITRIERTIRVGPVVAK